MLPSATALLVFHSLSLRCEVRAYVALVHVFALSVRDFRKSVVNQARGRQGERRR